jgi:hypothetical protein
MNRSQLNEYMLLSHFLGFISHISLHEPRTEPKISHYESHFYFVQHALCTVTYISKNWHLIMTILPISEPLYPPEMLACDLVIQVRVLWGLNSINVKERGS